MDEINALAMIEFLYRELHMLVIILLMLWIAAFLAVSIVARTDRREPALVPAQPEPPFGNPAHARQHWLDRDRVAIIGSALTIHMQGKGDMPGRWMTPSEAGTLVSLTYRLLIDAHAGGLSYSQWQQNYTEQERQLMYWLLTDNEALRPLSLPLPHYDELAEIKERAESISFANMTPLHRTLVRVRLWLHRKDLVRIS